MSDEQWNELRAVWLRDASVSDDAAVLAQLGRVARARRIARATRVAVVLAGISALGGAVAHAVTPLEAIVAIAIGVTIAASWLAVMAIERRQQASLAAEGHTYVRARCACLSTEWRLIRFIWAIVGLELAFLVPWWAGGVRVHFGGFATVTAVFAWWLPMAGLAGFTAWSVRRYRILRQEWRELGRFDAEPGTSNFEL